MLNIFSTIMLLVHNHVPNPVLNDEVVRFWTKNLVNFENTMQRTETPFIHYTHKNQGVTCLTHFSITNYPFRTISPEDRIGLTVDGEHFECKSLIVRPEWTSVRVFLHCCSLFKRNNVKVRRVNFSSLIEKFTHLSTRFTKSIWLTFDEHLGLQNNDFSQRLGLRHILVISWDLQQWAL